MSIGIASENSQKKGKKNYEKLVLANNKFITQQIEINMQVANLSRHKEKAVTDMNSFQTQLSVLATSISNIEQRQASSIKSMIEMMIHFSQQLDKFQTDIANNKNNNSLPPNLFPYPQLMPPHLQPTAMMMRAHYDQ